MQISGHYMENFLKVGLNYLERIGMLVEKHSDLSFGYDS